MTGCRASPFNAENLLDEMFATGGKQRGKGATTVLLVDEMDLLLTRTQRVLYNLMEWPLRKGSRLAVIGIANTMDLPERFLPRICRCALYPVPPYPARPTSHAHSVMLRTNR